MKLQLPVEILLPRHQVDHLLEMFNTGKEGIRNVKEALSQVDSKSAKAWSPADEARGTSNNSKHVFVVRVLSRISTA